MENYGQSYLKKLETIQKLPKIIRYEAIRTILQTNYSEAGPVIRQGERYVASSIFVPSEIPAAFDLKYLVPELIAVTLCQMNIIKDLPTIMNRQFSDFSCFCTGMKGLKALYDYHILPKPDYILVSSAMCDDAMKMWGLIGRELKVDSFILDIPYHHENQESVRYLAEQLKEMTRFISERTGRPLSEERLKQACRYSNEANTWRQRIFTLRQQHPALMRLNDLFSLYPFFTQFGLEKTVDVYRTLHAELQEVIEKKAFPLSTDHFRILWLGMIPLTNMGFLSYLEKDLNLGVVAEELMYYADFDGLDEDRPFKSLAKKLIHYHTVGTVQNRISKIETLLRQYNIDGVVHFSHTSCRSFNGGVRFVKDFCAANNMPFVELSGDVGDRDNFSLESLKTRMEAFREVLDHKAERHDYPSI